MPLALHHCPSDGPEEDIVASPPEESSAAAEQAELPEMPAEEPGTEEPAAPQGEIPEELDRVLAAFAADAGQMDGLQREEALAKLIETTWATLPPGAHDLAAAAWARHGLEWQKGYGWRVERMSEPAQSASGEGEASAAAPEQGPLAAVLAREHAAREQAQRLLEQMLPPDVLDRVRDAPAGERREVTPEEAIAALLVMPRKLIRGYLEHRRYRRAERAAFCLARARLDLEAGELPSEEVLASVERTVLDGVRNIHRLKGDPYLLGRGVREYADLLLQQVPDSESMRDRLDAMVERMRRMIQRIETLILRITGAQRGATAAPSP